MCVFFPLFSLSDNKCTLCLACVLLRNSCALHCFNFATLSKLTWGPSCVSKSSLADPALAGQHQAAPRVDHLHDSFDVPDHDLSGLDILDALGVAPPVILAQVHPDKILGRQFPLPGGRFLLLVAHAILRARRGVSRGGSRQVSGPAPRVF